MPTNKINITITLYVDTKRLFDYLKSDDPKTRFITEFCSFGQSENIKNDDFITRIKVSEVSAITWQGQSSSIPSFGEVNILGIISESVADVFSEIICTGKPKIVIGKVENPLNNGFGSIGERYTIYFSFTLGDGNYIGMYTIDPKIEVNL